MTLFYKYLCRVCLPIGTRNAEFYRFHGVSDDRLFLVPYTVDNDLFRQATEKYREDIDSIKDELGLPKSMPVVLFVSKMQPRKRAIDLLRAYHRLRKQGTVAALVFVGSGSEEVALKDYVELHHVPDVYFFGFQNQSELPKFYAMADVFVLPSENEPWGLIINEVMCAGLPMVASEEIGAVADLVHYGENGFTFRAGDIDVLTGHLRILVNDANLRDRMGENSLKIIVKWDFERCVEGISQALSKVASAKR